MRHFRQLVVSLSDFQRHAHVPSNKEAGLGLVAACLAVFIGACGLPASQPPPSVAKLSSAEVIVTAIVGEVTKLQRKTVAVIEFSELSGTAYVPSPKGRLLTERITTQLVSSGKVEVVERAQLDKIIGELKLGVSGMFDEAKAKSIGKLLGVEAIVTGTLIGVGDETEIHSRMVRVEDGMILAAVTTRDIIHLEGQPSSAVSAAWPPMASSLKAKTFPTSAGSHAIIKTKYGDMDIVFFPEKAPKHVENFIALAKSGFYNSTIFHRVIPGFMIQGGDPNTKDLQKTALYGQGGPGYTIKAEFSNTPHKRGIVSMARSSDPNSAGSQFFVMVSQSPSLDGKYTVFGEVVKGIEVADKIVNLPRNSQDLPTERVEMTVSIIE